MLRSILHCDMNNFYASVECMLDPALKKYPIAVCGSVEERHGIVLAKNYKAKAFDVKTGDAVWQAKQKCKDLVVVPPHYEEYIKYSKLARSVYERYTDQVEPYGMDECWLDISGTESLFGSPEKVANEIRETMKFELGLTISVGVSFNKIFAKLGSDMKKPDAVTVIPKDTFKEKIWGLPAADLLGVGRATQRVLDSYCIRTIGDVEYQHLSYDGSILGMTSFTEMGVQVFEDDDNEAFFFLDGKTVLVEKDLNFDSKLKGRKNFTLMHEGSHQIFKMLFPNDYGVTQKSAGVHYYKANSERNKPISDWEEWQANTLGAAILLPENLIKQGMYLFSLGEKIECLNKIYYPSVYKRFDALADFLGCSKKALAIRMKQLGLLKKEYLDNPFDLVTVYPEVSEL